MRRDRAELVWPLLACLGAVLPPACVLLAGHTLVWRDTAQMNAPLRGAIVEALRAARVPGWNPWEGTGQTLYAQLLHGVLHPVSVATALVTSSTDALILALVVFAALGAWLAARQLGCSPAASAGAALAFALSGYVLGMADNTSYLMPSASAPWAVAGLVAAARRPGGWLAAALAVATLALSGDPGSAIAFTVVGGCLAWAVGGWRGLVRAGLGSVLGIALSAIQLVPAWLYMADTARGAGILNAGDLRRWALAPWRILEFVAPGFFVGLPRSFSAPVFAALDGATPDRFPFAPSVFIGAATLLLAIAGARGNRVARWLAGLALLFLWLALGYRAGARDLLSGVPVWGALRYWEKMVAPVTLCVALAAGMGIDALRERGARSAFRLALAGVALALLALGLLWLPAVSTALGDPGVAALARRHLQVGLAHAAAGLALLAAALLAERRWPGRLAGALVAVLFVQSAAASPFSLHPGDRAALAVRPPVLDAPPPGPRTVAPLGCDFVEGRGDLDAIDLLNACERRLGRPATNDDARVDTIATYSSLTASRWDMVLGSPLFWPLARRFGTTHVLAYPPRTRQEAAGLEAATSGALGYRTLDEGQLRVWELPHRAWASFAPAVRVAPDRDTAGAMLAEELEAGRPTVVVETRAPPAVSGGRVLSIDRRAEQVVIEAESRGDGVLVVNDAWAPGWRATIDGQDAEVMPADVLVRAVRWPAGRHRAVMRYSPPGLVAGALVSLLAAVAAAGALAWQRRRAQ